MPLKDNAVLYYLFHFLYAGHPADILGKLWITYDIDIYQQEQKKRKHHAHINRSEVSEATSSPWEALDGSLKESWRAIGVMVSL